MASVSAMPGSAAAPNVLVKTIAVGALNVQVTLMPLPNEPVPSWHVTAVVGNTKVEQRHSIGASSGQIGVYDLPTLQAELDAVRLAVATSAANIESVRQLAQQLT